MLMFMQRIRRFVPVVMLAMCSVEPAPAAAEEGFLNEQSLRDTLIGHSLQADAWMEFYSPDGTILGKARLFGVRSYTGRWTILADRVCYDYDGSAYDTCSRLKLQNSKVYHYSLSGSLKSDGVAVRLPGNRLDAF